MESIFEKRLTVTPDYCDASGALSPLAAFTIFQGIAAQHAEVLGVGSSAMAKKGEFWLTVHTRVDLFERAYLMDELTVRTWAEACSERDVRTYRSYTLSRGEAVIARGKSGISDRSECFTGAFLEKGTSWRRGITEDPQG
ncbi:thioesterase superfamily protein [human gut metagenome]|uniref:Thioesterase superfamily protein n=1 Tax=human gut metagenome TaxID=408170 RepID=K1T109_9ZZZZ